MEVQIATLNEQFPADFFLQRHRPVVMPETHSHSHVEVLLPIGCSLTYLIQAGLYQAEDGR